MIARVIVVFLGTGPAIIAALTVRDLAYKAAAAARRRLREHQRHDILDAIGVPTAEQAAISAAAAAWANRTRWSIDEWRTAFDLAWLAGHTTATIVRLLDAAPREAIGRARGPAALIEAAIDAANSDTAPNWATAT